MLMEELGEGGEEEEAGKIAAEMMGGPCEEVEEHEWKADREQYAGPVTKDDASQGHAAGKGPRADIVALVESCCTAPI